MPNLTFTLFTIIETVESLYKEVLRWGVPVPLSMLIRNQYTTWAENLLISDLPHRLMEDDVYKDMHIPKGSLIFGNIWYVMLLMHYFGVPWLAILFSITSITRYTHLILHAYRAMMRNEKIYPDAASFRPERFMVPTTPEMERKMNPKNFVFGFGRR